MTRPVELLAAAQQDVEQAVRWYNQQSPGLGDSFLLHLDDTLAWVQRHPELYPLDSLPVRRALTRRFPFAIYYRILPHAIQVVAILNCRVNPATHHARSAKLS